MTKTTESQNKENLDRIADNEALIPEDVNVDNHDEPGLLPPQALPTPPPPPNTQDTSTLLSPWWSEEPPTEIIETEAEPFTSNAEKEPSLPTLAHTEKDPTSNPSILNISVLSFGQSSPKDSTEHWKERCILMATTTELSAKSKTQDSNNVQKELEEIFDKSKECSMICFLRTSRELARSRLLKQFDGDESKMPTTFAVNPFYGTWISVAKTPQKCKEHLLNAGNISSKSLPDYYTLELGEELSHSGEYVTKAVNKTFSPLQHLSQRYIESWKNGNQQAFFSKFWTSVQKGDAFHLVKDSTKRLIENALGHDKKPSDKK
ncbi:unnamed protein product [Mucor hiemalis]